MPSNTEPEILISPTAWQIRLESFIKKNWYLMLIFFIVLLPVLVILFNRFQSPVAKKPSIPANPPLVVDNRLSCPITKGFCDNFQEVSKDGKFIGIGTQHLATRSAMVAAFDGKIVPSTRITASNEVYFIAYLIDKSLNKQASYWYKGPPAKARTIKKGEVIATPSGVQIKEYLNNAFIFSVSDSKDNPIHLTKKDFQ